MKIKIPYPILKLIKNFQDQALEIYPVGGAVRSFLLEKKTNDWDFATSAKPEEILKLYPKNSFYRNKYGTVTILEKDNKKKLLLEITTFRKEFGYSYKRNPDKIIWVKT